MAKTFNYFQHGRQVACEDNEKGDAIDGTRHSTRQSSEQRRSFPSREENDVRGRTRARRRSTSEAARSFDEGLPSLPSDADREREGEISDGNYQRSRRRNTLFYAAATTTTKCCKYRHQSSSEHCRWSDETHKQSLQHYASLQRLDYDGSDARFGIRLQYVCSLCVGTQLILALTFKPSPSPHICNARTGQIILLIYSLIHKSAREFETKERCTSKSNVRPGQQH